MNVFSICFSLNNKKEKKKKPDREEFSQKNWVRHNYWICSWTKNLNEFHWMSRRQNDILILMDGIFSNRIWMSITQIMKNSLRWLISTWLLEHPKNTTTTRTRFFRQEGQSTGAWPNFHFDFFDFFFVHGVRPHEPHHRYENRQVFLKRDIWH